MTARRLLTHWQRKTLMEAQRDGAPVRETGHVPAQDGGGGRQMAEARPRRRKPHGRLPGPPPSTGGRAALWLGRNTQPARSPQTTARQGGDPGVTIPNPALCKHRTEDAVRVTQRLGRSRSDSPSHRDGQRAVGRRRPGPTALTGLLSLSLNEFKRRSL